MYSVIPQNFFRGILSFIPNDSLFSLNIIIQYFAPAGSSVGLNFLKLVLQEQHRRLFLRLLPAPMHVFHDHVAVQKTVCFFWKGVVGDVR